MSDLHRINATCLSIIEDLDRVSSHRSDDNGRRHHDYHSNRSVSAVSDSTSFLFETEDDASTWVESTICESVWETESEFTVNDDATRCVICGQVPCVCKVLQHPVSSSTPYEKNFAKLMRQYENYDRAEHEDQILPESTYEEIAMDIHARSNKFDITPPLSDKFYHRAARVTFYQPNRPSGGKSHASSNSDDTSKGSFTRGNTRQALQSDSNGGENDVLKLSSSSASQTGETSRTTESQPVDIVTVVNVRTERLEKSNTRPTSRSFDRENNSSKTEANYVAPIPRPRKKLAQNPTDGDSIRPPVPSGTRAERHVPPYEEALARLSNVAHGSLEAQRRSINNISENKSSSKVRRKGVVSRDNSDSDVSDSNRVARVNNNSHNFFDSVLNSDNCCNEGSVDYQSNGYNDDFDYHVTFTAGGLNQSNHSVKQSNYYDGEINGSPTVNAPRRGYSSKSEGSQRISPRLSSASSQTGGSDSDEVFNLAGYAENADDIADVTVHKPSFDENTFQTSRDYNFNKCYDKQPELPVIEFAEQKTDRSKMSSGKMRSVSLDDNRSTDNGMLSVNNNFYKLISEGKLAQKKCESLKTLQYTEGSLADSDEKSSSSTGIGEQDATDDNRGSGAVMIDYSVGSVKVTNEILKKYDITGLQEPARFPWQHDIGVQCEILASNNPVPSTANNNPANAQLSIKRQDALGRSSSVEELESEKLVSGWGMKKSKSRGTNSPPSDGDVGSNYEHSENSLVSKCVKDSVNSTDVVERGVPYETPLKRLDRLLYKDMNAHGIPYGRGSIEHETIVEEDEDDEDGVVLERGDVLKSPTMSPIPWQPAGIAGEHLNMAVSSLMEQNRAAARLQKKALRQVNGKHGPIGGDTSDDSDEGEQQLPVVSTYRRERRSAVIDTKNVGDVSPGNLTPASSEDDLDDETPKEMRRRKKNNMTFPRNHTNDPRRRLVKRNTVSDFNVSGNTLPLALEQEDPKKMKAFSFLKLIDRKRGKDSTPPLDLFFANYKQSVFKDNNLARYKDVHWSEIIATSDKHGDSLAISETERKRREAVWELFTSECVFLVDHLMILKHCFLEPLKKAQVEGLLMIAEPHTLFGNLDEICYVSYMFCKDFISSLLKDMSPTEFGRTEVLINSFRKLTEHSKNGEVYHNYCLNYSNALSQLENLRKNEEFYEFEKWCEKDPRCRKLVITDFLVAPMQHWTKMPLLLSNIRKYTDDTDERIHLTNSLESVINSLEKLEDKMKWLKNFERIQKVQSQLVWPPVTEMEHRAFVPESLKSMLNKQPCERLLASPKRQLLCEGLLSLIENSKTVDVYIFLFDDILLVTKVKKPPRKKHTSENSASVTTSVHEVNTEGAVFVVYRQPIALDRFSVHDIGQGEASSNGLKNVLCIVQITRFQQIIGVYTLQAPNEATKATWLKHLREAKEKYAETIGGPNRTPSSPYAPLPGSPRLNSNRSPRRLRKLNMLKQLHERAKSMDVMQLPAPNGAIDQSGSSENLNKLDQVSEATEPVFL